MYGLGGPVTLFLVLLADMGRVEITNRRFVECFNFRLLALGRPFIDLLFFTFLFLLLSLVENKISFADGKSADEILVVVVADFQKLISLLFR